MKTKIITLIGVFLLSLVLSCTKDDGFTQVGQNYAASVNDSTRIFAEPIDSPLGELVLEGDEFFTPENTLKSGYTPAILEYVAKASSYKNIPTYAFRCYDNYKWGYRHLRQPDDESCSWTSYVICTGNIASVSGKSYDVSADQVYKVRKGCGYSKYITELWVYAYVKDWKTVKSNIVSLPKKGTSYLGVMKKMMTMMETNKTPFIAIAKSGSKAHYVVVYSIYWKQGLTGSKIYYMDPLANDRGSFDKNIRNMDFLEFMNLMQSNINENYNFLELLPI